MRDASCDRRTCTVLISTRGGAWARVAVLAAATRILLYSVLHTVLEVLYILYSILIVLPIDTATRKRQHVNDMNDVILLHWYRGAPRRSRFSHHSHRSVASSLGARLRGVLVRWGRSLSMRLRSSVGCFIGWLLSASQCSGALITFDHLGAARISSELRLLSWRRPYNVWVCHTSWGDHRETFQVRWHLPQGLESELMGLARDMLSHGTCADFMAAHHCTRGLHTHTHPYATHTHTFLRVPEITGRYFGRCATCFKVWRVREGGYQEMCPVVQHM